MCRCFSSRSAFAALFARGRAALPRVLPHIELAELPGLGHMAPVTNPEEVNPVICQFLERVAQD